MALFVVLSVFSGLENYALSFSNEIDPDVVVMPSAGKKIILSTKQIQLLKENSDIESYSGVIEDRVIFTYGEKQLVALIKAVDSNYVKTVAISEHINHGNWLQPNTNDAIIGNGLANELSAGMYSNDKLLEVLAMKPGTDMITMPQDAYVKLPLYPAGIYSLQNIETDNKYIFTDINVGKDLLGYNTNEFSKIEIKVTNINNENRVINQLQNIFPNSQIKTRSQLNESLYKMLKTESLAIYLIFTLIIIDRKSVV